jgi:DNA-binding MarR family transcriptional regulator
MTDAPGPAPSLEEAVNELTLAVGQLLRRLRTQGNSNELNLSQMGAMVRLEQNGWMTIADLARAEAMKPQSMGTLLTGLEQESLVKRKPDPKDGRQILFALTAAGVEERRKSKAARRDWLIAAMADLNPAERRTLFAAIPLLKRLGDAGEKGLR